MYQWLAMGQLVAAAAVGLIFSSPLPTPKVLTAGRVLVALVVALGAGFSMGVDFPDVHAPLARLTPTPTRET